MVAKLFRVLYFSLLFRRKNLALQVAHLFQSQLMSREESNCSNEQRVIHMVQTSLKKSRVTLHLSLLNLPRRFFCVPLLPPRRLILMTCFSVKNVCWSVKRDQSGHVSPASESMQGRCRNWLVERAGNFYRIASAQFITALHAIGSHLWLIWFH